MMGWLFGKRSPETHGFWLARICNEFMGEALSLGIPFGIVSEAAYVRCAALTVGVVNEMVTNSPLNQDLWANVRTPLENCLVDALEANIPQISGKPVSDRATLARRLAEGANDSCRHVLALSQQAQRLEGKADIDQLIMGFQRQQLTYIWPSLTSSQREEMLPAFTTVYMRRLQQPASRYLKRHFVQRR